MARLSVRSHGGHKMRDDVQAAAERLIRATNQAGTLVTPFASDARTVASYALEAGQEVARLTEELAQTRAHEHVLVIVGDMLARRLEWMVEEPTSGFDTELIDAIKARAKPDTEQWLQAITNAGFKRPGAALSTPGGPKGAES